MREKCFIELRVDKIQRVQPATKTRKNISKSYLKGLQGYPLSQKFNIETKLVQRLYKRLMGKILLVR